MVVEQPNAVAALSAAKTYSEATAYGLMPVRACNHVNIEPNSRRWVLVSIGGNWNNTHDLKFQVSQSIAEKGLIGEHFTPHTARGLTVPANRPAVLFKNDSHNVFQVRHGQRLGELLLGDRDRPCQASSGLA